MDVIERLGNCGIVPVCVIENADNAPDTARAMAAGGINAMEITMRTPAALDAIKNVARECADVLVGAGTVLNLDDMKRCLEQGAKFIVSPGFDTKMAEYALQNNIPYLPGCVTPTEIMQAISCGLKIVKFFPANVYGGLKGMKALAAPFTGIKFMPTGGVNADNVAEFLSADFIHAVGGSWICPKADVAAGNYSKITQLCQEALTAAMGFEIAHIGINNPDPETAVAVSSAFQKAFGFSAREGNSSIFASSQVEVMKSNYLGANGHIAVSTCNVERALNYLSAKGFAPAPETFKYKNGKLTAAYLKDDFGGFAVHLVKR